MFKLVQISQNFLDSPEFVSANRQLLACQCGIYYQICIKFALKNAASFYSPLFYSRTFLYPQGRSTVRIVLQLSLLLTLSKLLSSVLSVFLTDKSLKITVNFKSSRPEVFCKKGVLGSFAKFAGKQLCQSLFFNKVADLGPATLLIKRLWYRCFPVKFAIFLSTTFLTEHLRWLLLEFQEIITKKCTSHQIIRSM